MNPADEKKSQKTPSGRKKSNIFPAIVIFLLIIFVGGTLFYLNTTPESPIARLLRPDASNPTKQTVPEGEAADSNRVNGKNGRQEKEIIVFSTVDKESGRTEENASQTDDLQNASTIEQTNPQLHPTPLHDNETNIPVKPPAVPDQAATLCENATQGITDFYRHLDSQPYMDGYHLATPSRIHFTALVQKLLSNPPQVTRESDDLYTILKNTAHFFRVSGKDNILMLKGILDNEKDRLEEILADYHFVVAMPECSQTTYAKEIIHDAIYEYACFFLNTMGGRQYLFRRDSQSRMVVTYYAILIIDQANKQQKNRHGIALKPAVDMLISEMETGGSALKSSDLYLDTLYDLKERYQ
ncbi:MAG: hypothetical protein K9K37_00370 [Desulfocapsa sp.]|nr:hypothetical protein [Desulfocapsa sp.]